MKARSGFTLIEITIALVISGVVALLAYGSLHAGFASRDRLEQYRTEVESGAVMRSLMMDALRHPAQAALSGHQSFAIAPATHAPGLNIDRLQFVSRGVSPPLGAGALWAITLDPSPDGLRLLAQPLEETAARPMTAVFPAIHGMRVRVMASPSSLTWQSGWSSRNTVPHAVEISFLGAGNEEAGPPIVVRMGMEEGLRNAGS